MTDSLIDELDIANKLLHAKINPNIVVDDGRGPITKVGIWTSERQQELHGMGLEVFRQCSACDIWTPEYRPFSNRTIKCFPCWEATWKEGGIDYGEDESYTVYVVKRS